MLIKSFKYIGNFIFESQKKRKLICNLSTLYRNSTINFLDVLKYENLILGYSFDKSTDIFYVYLKYSSNIPIIKYIKFYGFTSRPINIKYKKLFLSLRNNKGSTFIISTNRGLITGQTAFDYNCGGLLICKIN